MKTETAELCGALIGDGWIQKNGNAMFISGYQTEDREYYGKRIVQLLRTTLGREIRPRKFPYWNTYGIGIYRNAEIKKFIGFGMPTGKKGTKTDIPKIIQKSDIENKKAFLRGLFDTDGTMYPMRQNGKYTRLRLRISLISGKLINSVKMICDELGIKYSNPSPRKVGKRRPNKTYIFEINKKDSIEKWFSIVKSQNPKHTTKFYLWKKIGHLSPRTTVKERKCILSHITKLKTKNTGN